MTPAPPDWFAKALAVFNTLSGWVLFAIALTGAIILIAPIRVGEIDLVQIRHDWGGWILAATILFGLLVLAKLAQRAEVSITHAWQRRAERRTWEKAEAQTLAHLDTLSPDERAFLSECLSQGTSTRFTHPRELWAFRAAAALVSKGLASEVIMNPGGERPYTIQPFVWKELQRRRENFLPGNKPIVER